MNQPTAQPTSNGATLVELGNSAVEYMHDPLGFVYWNWPWGTPRLRDQGPDAWQTSVLQNLGEALITADDGKLKSVQMAVAAANGAGKSALVCWIIIWAFSTWPFTRGTVTANTATQLRTKTWAELGKWHATSLVAPLMNVTATSVAGSGEDSMTWRIDAVPWNKDRPEAVAGLHNQGKRELVIFDEASAIDDVIWEYADATLSAEDTESIWMVFGNATRNSGRFRECWRRFAHRWLKPTGPGIRDGRVDGRDCRYTNKKKIAQWIEDYGEDHDFVRVRVKAEFPRIGDSQFFASDVIAASRLRSIDNDLIKLYPAVIGVDVAAGGADSTVIRCRRGQKIMWTKVYPHTPNTMQVVGYVKQACDDERNVRSVCVDANGVGKGVADRLTELEGMPSIVHVYGAAQSTDPIRWLNLRAELHDRCRDWLPTGAIDDDPLLVEEMEALQSGYTASMQIQIEAKQDFKDRVGRSPDRMDSLTMTFAEGIYPAGTSSIQRRHAKRQSAPPRWR